MSLTQEFIDNLTKNFSNLFISKVFQHDELTVEINKEFSEILRKKYPNANIFTEDAISFLDKFEIRFKRKIDIIVSGIPLVSLDKNTREKICELSVKNLSEKGMFFQITYFIRCSFPNNIIKKFGLSKKLQGFTPLNIPPAFIWKIYK